VLPRRYRRIPPYLYSPEEVAALMSAADGLTPPLRAATWRTLIGLLAVTGMRQGEACRLPATEAHRHRRRADRRGRAGPATADG
jgi:site-specific recombinase XerD